MPSLELIHETKEWRLENVLGREEIFRGGDVPISPLAPPGISFLRLRRLRCACYGYRSVAMTEFGYTNAILDTGAPISVIPKYVWNGTFRFVEGTHFEVCNITDFGERFRSQLLATALTCRAVRLKVPIVLVGTSYAPENRLRIDNLIAQLSDTDEPKEMLLGLWGGVFEGRKLAVERQPNSDDLAARFEW